MLSKECLDHTVINVKYDLDAAATLFRKLGFNLTPRGFHSHGSMNHLMVFENDYLELIGIPEGKKIERQDLKNAPVGINGLVFKARNIDETYTRMKEVGFEGDPPKAFHRPVETDGEKQAAKFQTATVRKDVFAGGRVYYCQHNTPDLVWRSEWQNHPNGVTSIAEFIIVTHDTDAEIGRFALLLNTEPKVDSRRARYLDLQGFRLTVLSPEQYAIRYRDLALPLESNESIFGAIAFTTNALARLTELLDKSDDIVTDRYPTRTIAHIAAYNTVLEFVDINSA